jgi:sulfur-oxidizing protein SoxA
MLLKIAKTSVLLAITSVALNATDFNTQAEKDRKALIKYTVAKFKDPMGDKYTYFPYSSDEELKAMKSNISAGDFKDGTYSYNVGGKKFRDEMMEMPPFDENIENGEELYNKYFTKCFSSPEIKGEYPKFDEKQGKVITLTTAIMTCAKDQGLEIGKKAWNYDTGLTTDVEAYIAYSSQEAEKKVNTKITSAAAAAAYEHGKQLFYTQRGYLELSCAECHVQGAGQRVRLEYMSPTLGHVTHFPVYRSTKEKLLTIENRVRGCIKDTGQIKPKHDGKFISDLVYFMSYMSNGMELSGPDIRK